MSKNVLFEKSDFDEEVGYCLERQMIPAWERYGMSHLTVSANSLADFLALPQPEQVETWAHKTKSRSAIKNRRRAGLQSIIESWPEDDMVNVRFPMFVYVRSGQAVFYLNDYAVLCPQEHFLFLTPGVPRSGGERPHLQAPYQGKQCEVWWFRSVEQSDHVALSICYSREDQHVNSGQYYIVQDPYVVQLFHLFAQEVQGRQQHYQKACFAALQTFLLLFAREIAANRFFNRGETNLPPSAEVVANPIQMAQHYIEKNLNHALTIDVVAQAVFMTRSNFTRRFRQETGQTFCAYLTQRRLEEARHWLAHESCSIEIVCKFVGLKSSRLHQLFQQYYGTTPGEFRKEHKK